MPDQKSRRKVYIKNKFFIKNFIQKKQKIANKKNHFFFKKNLYIF